MAKKRRGARRSRRFQVIKVQQSADLGTLVTNVGLKTVLWDITQDAYVIAADLTWTLFGMDLLDGPVDVGLAHGDLTNSEIVNALDASPKSDSDIIALELTRRPVRLVGTFPQPENTGAGKTLNDGKKIRTKCRFAITGATDLVFFGVNRGVQPLTVDTTLAVAGKVYINWQ